MKIKVGILGFGLSGRFFHAPFLQARAGFTIAAVSSSDPAKVHAYLPGVKVHSSPADLLADPEVELVIHCGPNDAHYSLSAAALRAGKHVVVEKPFVNSAAEARSLILLAEESKRALVAYQNRRWDGDFLTLRKLRDEGRLGEVMHFESRFDLFKPGRRPERWRERGGPGSGTWYDLGAHLVDQMYVLFGEPEAVNAEVFPQRPGAVADDFFHVVFSYGAMRAVLQSSLFAAAAPRFLVYGTNATYVKFGRDPQEESLRSGGEASDPGFGEEPDSQHGALWAGNAGEACRVPTARGNYGAFYDALFSHIRGAGPAPVSLASSLRVIELLEAARRSAAEGRRLWLR